MPHIIMWDFIQPLKEWNTAFCDTMDEPWGHYAKWNNSDRERQTLYDLSYMWN